jgi:hypothetical protein
MTTKYGYRNGVLSFFDSATHERVLPVAPIVFKDDFIGAVNANWTLVDLHADATEVKIANQHGGVFGLATGATAAEQEASMYYTNLLEWSATKGFIAEFVAQHFVVPTLLNETYFGMANAYVKGRLSAADEGPTIHAMFMAVGSGAIVIHTDNNVAADNNGIATGVTVVTGAYHTYRIDFTTITDVLFYIDGARVASGTTFDLTGAGNLQPYISVYKSGGAGLGTLYIDSVKIWSKR